MNYQSSFNRIIIFYIHRYIYVIHFAYPGNMYTLFYRNFIRNLVDDLKIVNCFFGGHHFMIPPSSVCSNKILSKSTYYWFHNLKSFSSGFDLVALMASLRSWTRPWGSICTRMSVSRLSSSKRNRRAIFINRGTPIAAIAETDESRIAEICKVDRCFLQRKFSKWVHGIDNDWVFSSSNIGMDLWLTWKCRLVTEVPLRKKVEFTRQWTMPYNFRTPFCITS